MICLTRRIDSCSHPRDMRDRESHRQPLLDPKPLIRGPAARRDARGRFGGRFPRSGGLGRLGHGGFLYCRRAMTSSSTVPDSQKAQYRKFRNTKTLPMGWRRIHAMTDTGESESAVFSPPRSSREGPGVVARVLANPDDEYRLVAEIEGRAVGIAALGRRTMR
jgi:hypothetical protein